jgi:hypothetical protein
VATTMMDTRARMIAYSVRLWPRLYEIRRKALTPFPLEVSVALLLS